jgi:hypothetical protein
MIFVWFLVFYATFSNISAISWRPVLVVEGAGVPGEMTLVNNCLSPLLSKIENQLSKLYVTIGLYKV